MLPLALLGDCSSPPTAVPVPEPLVPHARIPGYQGIRYGHDRREANFVADYQTAMQRVFNLGREYAAGPDLSGIKPDLQK